MKIQILYFEGCPNHRPAVDLVDEVVAAFNVGASVEEVEVQGPEDSVELRFLGSPTILVDGVDIEPAARSRTDFGYSCRTYNGAGLPSRDMVVAAVKGEDYAQGAAAGTVASVDCCNDNEEAPGQSDAAARTNGFGPLILGGSVIAAVVASACCWLPLLLIGMGISAGGIGAAFEQTRPIFLAVAFLLLALGFYFTYIRKEKCAPGSACETPNPRLQRANRIIFWIATVGVVAFALFPKYVSVFQTPADGAMTDVAVAGTLMTFNVEGMSCEGCSISVHNALLKVNGVLNAEVQFEKGRALVKVDSSSPPSNESLIAAIKMAGYEGSATEL